MKVKSLSLGLGSAAVSDLGFEVLVVWGLSALRFQGLKRTQGWVELGLRVLGLSRLLGQVLASSEKQCRTGGLNKY